MPLAWAVPMTVRTLCWLNTRSTATASGRRRSIHSSSPGLDRDQPLRDRQVGRGADHADADQGQGPADVTVDHADAAPGQPRVDPQHAHCETPRSSEHLFVPR